MTEEDVKRLEARLDRLERRMWIAMFVAVVLAIVVVELYELASPRCAPGPGLRAEPSPQARRQCGASDLDLQSTRRRLPHAETRRRLNRVRQTGVNSVTPDVISPTAERV